jgi:hypothetical protein
MLRCCELTLSYRLPFCECSHCLTRTMLTV